MKLTLALLLALSASPALAQESKPANAATEKPPGAATEHPGAKAADKQCGGFAGLKCDDGDYCKMTADHPDAMGICVKDGKGRSCGGDHDQACPKGTKCKGATKAKKVCK